MLTPSYLDIMYSIQNVTVLEAERKYGLRVKGSPQQL